MKIKYFITNCNKITEMLFKRQGFLYSSCDKSSKPKLERSEIYNQLDYTHIDFFTKILSKDGVLSNLNDNHSNDLSKYNFDWMKKYLGNSKLVLKPRTNTQVAEILKYCNSEKLAIVPQSGNTGLVGGSVPLFDEIVLSMEKFNKIIDFDKKTNTVYSESGVILETMNKYLLENFNREFPLDLGAKGSCMLGGNLSTNAGGIHFVKYGSLKSNTTEIEYVSANGEIITINEKNDLYGIKNLMIGSEGTLGVITKLKCKTFEKMMHSNVLLIELPSFEKLTYFYLMCKKMLGNKISAIEFFDSYCMKLTQQELGLENPFEHSSIQQNDNDKNIFYLLIEISANSSDESENVNDLINYLDKLYQENEKEHLVEAIISQDNSQLKSLWELREKISEASLRMGHCFKYDISLDLGNMYLLVEILRKKLEGKASVLGYGHVGDCNLHINVCMNTFEKNEKYYEVLNILEPFVFDYLKSVNGSISAEHGIGQAKVNYLNRNHSSENIELMKSLKRLFDPQLILNPYKILLI